MFVSVQLIQCNPDNMWPFYVNIQLMNSNVYLFLRFMSVYKILVQIQTESLKSIFDLC